MLFAVVKRYERNGVDFADWEYKPNDLQEMTMKFQMMLHVGVNWHLLVKSMNFVKVKLK